MRYMTKVLAHEVGNFAVAATTMAFLLIAILSVIPL